MAILERDRHQSDGAWCHLAVLTILEAGIGIDYKYNLGCNSAIDL